MQTVFIAEYVWSEFTSGCSKGVPLAHMRKDNRDVSILQVGHIQWEYSEIILSTNKYLIFVHVYGKCGEPIRADVRTHSYS
jgi:hypothetical protein